MQNVNRSDFEAKFPMYNEHNLRTMDVRRENDAVYVYEKHPAVDMLHCTAASVGCKSFDHMCRCYIENDSRKYVKVSEELFNTCCNAVISAALNPPPYSMNMETELMARVLMIRNIIDTAEDCELKTKILETLEKKIPACRSSE
jgi:hypothetical protein